MTYLLPQLPLALVVDPDRFDQDTLRESLLTHFRVLVVPSVAEAWKIFVAHHPAAVVVALRWPDGQDWGMTLIEQARARPDLDGTVIVGTITTEDKARRIKALQDGADDCLVKPINLQLLPYKLRLYARTRGTIGRYR